MVGIVAAERLVLRAAGGLVADQVRPGAAESRGTHRLVLVDHDLALRRLLDAVEVVVVAPLRVVVVAVRQDVADVARFDGVVAEALHEAVRRIKAALVVARRGARLVVHHELDALLLRIGVESLEIEVGIGRDEIEDGVLLLAEPVLEADVPAFDEHFVETVLGRKVEVADHVRRIRRVHRRIGLVRPVLRAGDHRPPDADILDGMNPARIRERTRLVEVERQARGKDVRPLRAADDRAPRRTARRLEPPLRARRIRGQV